MNITEALEFVQSASWVGTQPCLERIRELMHLLGDPQEQLKFVHITGTNGKGSTAAMLSSILTAAGYNTGLFTSPHLQRYNERIRVNGRDISDDDLCVVAEQTKAAVDRMTVVPTEFDRFTAMAFLHFARCGCDIVVLEVGLGGLLDATNVIPAPEAAIITNIGLEHTEYLGNTLAEIAATKSGIIKPGCDVVLYGQSSEVEDVVRARCAECGCGLTVTDKTQQELLRSDLTCQVLRYRQRQAVKLRLLGTYQYCNAAVALDTVDVLIRRGFHISEDAVARGMATVQWPGRFEVLRQAPLVVVDGAHNPNGVAELAKCLGQYLPGRKITFVMGVLADKDYDDMLNSVAPYAKKFVTVTPESHRALDADDLRADIERRLGLPARSAGSVREGMALALKEAAPEDVICIFGSLYQVGEVREFFGY